MRDNIVKTSNVVRAVNAVQRLHDRGQGEEGMGLIHGRPGEGKTTTVTYLINSFDAVFLRARVSWTVTSMLSTLMQEIGREPEHYKAPMVEAAIEHFAVEQKMIVIDEADYLLRQTEMLDALRDIYDMAQVPVLMVMMEKAPRKIQSQQRLARFKRRITEWIHFDGMSKQDTLKVCQELPELQDGTPIEVGEDLAMRIHEEADANIGHVVIGLGKVETFARSNDLERVTVSEFGTRDLFDTRGPQ